MTPRFALWDVVRVAPAVRDVGGLEGTVTSPPVPWEDGVAYRVFLPEIEEGRTLPESALEWTGRVDRDAHQLAEAHLDAAERFLRARRRRARTLARRLRTPARRR